MEIKSEPFGPSYRIVALPIAIFPGCVCVRGGGGEGCEGRTGKEEKLLTACTHAP